MTYEKLKQECEENKGFEPGMALMILEAQKTNPKESTEQLANRINIPKKKLEDYLKLIKKAISISGKEMKEIIKNTKEVENAV